MTQQPVAEEESDFVRDFSMIVRTAMMAGMQLREIAERKQQNRQRQEELEGREAEAGAREVQRKLENEERKLVDEERQIKREQDKVAESLRRDAYSDKFWERAGNERIVTSLIAAQELSTAHNATAKVAYMEFADRIRDKWGVSVEAFNTHTDQAERREAILERLGQANPAGKERDATANRVYQEEKERLETEQLRRNAVPVAESERVALQQPDITADAYVAALTKKQVAELMEAAENRTEGGTAFVESIQNVQERLETVHAVPDRYGQLTRIVHDSGEHQRLDPEMTAAEYLDILGEDGRKQLEESYEAGTWQQLQDDRIAAVEAERDVRQLAADAAEQAGEAADAGIEPVAYAQALSEADRLHLINDVFPEQLTDEQKGIVAATEAGNRLEAVADKQRDIQQAVEAVAEIGEHKIANVQSPELYVAALSEDQRKQLTADAAVLTQAEGDTADRAYALRLHGRIAAAERGEAVTLSAHEVDGLTPTGTDLLHSALFTGEAEEFTDAGVAAYIAALNADEKKELYADFLAGKQDSDKRQERLDAAHDLFQAGSEQAETAYDKAGHHLAEFMQESPGAGYGRNQTEYFSHLVPDSRPSESTETAQQNRHALEDQANEREAAATRGKAEAAAEEKAATQAEDDFSRRFEAYIAAHPEVSKAEAIRAVIQEDATAERQGRADLDVDEISATKDHADADHEDTSSKTQTSAEQRALEDEVLEEYHAEQRALEYRARADLDADEISATKDHAEAQLHTSRAGDAEVDAQRDEADADRLRTEAETQDTNPMTEASAEQRALEDEAMEEYYAEQDMQERNHNHRDYVPDETRRQFPETSARRDHQRQNHRGNGPELKADTMDNRRHSKARNRGAGGQERGRDLSRGR
jgi:hypothetical protein